MSELYKKSGVNLFEADRLVNKLKILGDNFTEFAGSTTFEKNKIVACCDGIGSKILPLYERKYERQSAFLQRKCVWCGAAELCGVGGH